MNCDGMKPLVSEYVDGHLAPAKVRQIRLHLEQCEECSRLAGDLEALQQALQRLPLAQTSVQFESRLAARLAEAKRPNRMHSWLSRLTDTLRPTPALLRPALALGSAAAVAAGVVFFQRPIPTPPGPAPVAFDRSLVTHCIEQHRNYVAGQPLSDIAAQNLAAQSDGSDMVAATTIPAVQADDSF